MAYRLQPTEALVDGVRRIAREQLAKALAATEREAEGWEIRPRKHPARALEGGLRRTYARGRGAYRRARGAIDDELLHGWRKHVKYGGLHVRLLREAWPALLIPLGEETKRLADLLGEDHDLTVLVRCLEEEPPIVADTGDLGAVLGRIEVRRSELRAASLALGARLYQEAPKRWARGLVRCWGQEAD